MEVYAEAANQVQNVAPSSSRKKRSLWDTVNSDYRLKNCTPQNQLEYKIKHKVKIYNIQYYQKNLSFKILRINRLSLFAIQNQSAR